MIYFPIDVRKAYPNVVHTVGDVAYDADGKEVMYDLQVIENKVAELQAIETAKQEAIEAAKISAQSKLSALGLTVDEVKAILGTT
jgi:hypothetical protein